MFWATLSDFDKTRMYISLLEQRAQNGNEMLMKLQTAIYQNLPIGISPCFFCIAGRQDANARECPNMMRARKRPVYFKEIPGHVSELLLFPLIVLGSS